MLRPSDEEYRITRLIKLAKGTMEPKYAPFVAWLNKKYTVQILNIQTDFINHSTLRLQLIFEYETDLNKFFLKDRFTSSALIVRAIAKKYKELFSLPNSQSILVLFYAFEPLAKEEANTKISLRATTALKDEYKDMLWQIARFGQHVTFFFYTKAQLVEAGRSGLTNQLKAKYFEILKHFDEFNYFSLANFNAVFDSKENFDKNYDSNWRAYYN